MRKHATRRGREQFYRYQWLLRFITLIFRYFPKIILRILWSLLDFGSGRFSIGLRYAILNNLSAKFGDVISVGPCVSILHPENLTLGSNISIHKGCYIDAKGEIDIGDNVSIAHQTSLLSFEHTWEDSDTPIRDNPILRKKIVIENDVWIGCGVRILAGVHIGERSVVAAGAVVTRDLKGHAVYGGIPVRKIKEMQ